MSEDKNWIPRHNQTRKRCDCPNGAAQHESLTPEQRDYLRHLIWWLGETYTPNPSSLLVEINITHACGISRKALVRALEGYEHHDVPTLRAWLIKRGAP